ncbi:hypothetical protein PTKIN_Ptkin06aG0079300 [Pterospermum kingtungense]
MEGGGLNNMRSPLLSSEEEKMIQNGKVEYCNSVNGLKCEFFSKLPVKIYATAKSGSLAIVISTLDSLLDLLAGGILWFTHLSMKSIIIYKYSIGKLRVQPVGIIIFAVVMATLATAVKLVLWFYCRSLGSKIVRAYAKLVWLRLFLMINSTGGLTLLVPSSLHCIIDLELFWKMHVALSVSLVGQSAPPKVLQKLTYLVLRHRPQIKRVDTVRAYSFGVLFFVEVDIELPEDLPLKEAHAIGESLQINIEELPEVERAFIHLDFECEHKPEHSVLIRLPTTQP